MDIVTEYIFLDTKADGYIYDITKKIQETLLTTKFHEGNVLISCIGSTCSVSTIEFEKGLLEDFSKLFNKLVPNASYEHHKAWGDDNGRSHFNGTVNNSTIYQSKVNLRNVATNCIYRMGYKKSKSKNSNTIYR